MSLAALPITALVVWTALRSPLARSVVATPTGERWHAVETPLLGGVGIFAGLVGGVALAIAVGVVDPSGDVVGVLGACTLLFAAGLADDVRGLGPAAKLVAQLGAVAIVLASGLHVEAVNNPVLAYGVSILWLVGMTNAVNFLDHMDGVAATLVAVACGLFAIDAASAHRSDVVLVFALAVGCACAGFLPFNLRPGRAAAFMGDSGSQVLGFALGSIALLSTWKAAAPSLAAVLLPVLVLAIPILDTTLVTVTRLLEGRPVYLGGRDHTSHRLVYSGLSERRAVFMLALLTAAVGSTGLAYGAVGRIELTVAGVLVTFAVLVQFAGALAAVRPGGETADRRGHMLDRRRLLALAGDGVLVTAALAAAFAVRFGGAADVFQRDLFAGALPVLLASRYAVFIALGVYTRAARTAAREALRISVAVVVSEGIAVALLAMSDENPFATFSRSVFAIDALFCTALVVAARLGVRALASRRAHTGLGRAIVVMADRRPTHAPEAGAAPK